MAKYYIENNNWSEYVKEALDITPKRDLQFIIGGSSGSGGGNFDPAVNCPKNFIANYTCGNDTNVKTLKSNNALSKQVEFDCKTEFDKCAGATLNLGDDGVLTLKENDKVLWQSSNPNIIDKAIVVEEYKAKNGGAGEPTMAKYDRPFLKPGDFLDKDEFIGSASGTCILKMVEVVDVAGGGIITRSLQVLYNELGCDDETTKLNPVNKDSVRTFNIDFINREILGKIGYVDERRELKEYDEKTPNLIEYGVDAYDNVGKYGFSGADITNFKDVSLEQCKRECTDNEKCAGFVYEKVGRVCKLKNDDIFSLDKGYTRIINENSEYYIRTKSLSNDLIDTSCPVDASTGSILEWKNLSKLDASGNIIDASFVNLLDRKCGMLKYTENELKQKEEAHDKFTGFRSSISRSIALLKKQFYKLKRNYKKKKNSVDDKIKELSDNRQNIGDWTGDQLKQLESMNEDRDLNAISQNYKNILWSILAIIIIIGIIKLTRTVMGTPPSASVPTAAPTPAK